MSSRVLRVRLCWCTSVLAVVAAAIPAAAQGIPYRFDTDGVLPSRQGAVHVASQGLAESSVYSVSNGYLHASTLGTGRYSYYSANRHFNHAFPATLEWRAQVFQNDDQAVVVSLASASSVWSFNLAASGVEVKGKGGWLLAVPMKTRDAFHTYRVEISANRDSFDLYVDDVLLYSGDAVEDKGRVPALSWGDTAAKGDGKVDWDYVVLTQQVPLSLTPPALFSRVVPLSDQTKSAKSGSTIPLRFQLLNAVDGNVSSPDLEVETIDLSWVSTSAPGSLVEVESGPPDSAFRYDPTVGKTGGYIYNFSTKGLNAGTYSLVFNIGRVPRDYRLQFQIR